jgi:hypothetical protein
MILPVRRLEEVTQHAIQVLSREIGVSDTVRFLNQFINRLGDYTQEREALFQDLTLNDILAEIRRERQAYVERVGDV